MKKKELIIYATIPQFNKKIQLILKINLLLKKFYQKSFSIPIYPDLKYSQQRQILKLIINFLKKKFR